MEPLTREEALVGVALCAAYADGTMGADENEELMEQIASLPALAKLDDDALRAAMMKVDRIASKQGEQALLVQAASALPAELRATAFFLGADIVLADGELAAEERRFIDGLARTLMLPADTVSKIVDVVLIRNRA